MLPAVSLRPSVAMFVLFSRIPQHSAIWARRNTDVGRRWTTHQGPALRRAILTQFQGNNVLLSKVKCTSGYYFLKSILIHRRGSFTTWFYIFVFYPSQSICNIHIEGEDPRCAFQRDKTVVNMLLQVSVKKCFYFFGDHLLTSCVQLAKTSKK